MDLGILAAILGNIYNKFLSNPNEQGLILFIERLLKNLFGWILLKLEIFRNIFFVEKRENFGFFKIPA